MALLETRGDYQFADSMERLSQNVPKLIKAFEEQVEVNHNLMLSVKQLTEVIEYQNDQYKKLITKINAQTLAAENTRPDLVLM